MSLKRFNVYTAELLVDDEPDGYGAKYAPIGPVIGAERMAANLVVLERGERLCPYHYELAEAEWLIVLEGSPTVRTPDGDKRCRAGDIVHFPPAPEGAHQIANHADEPARVIMLAERRFPAISVYPDSDKVGVFMEDKPKRTLLPRAAKVHYWTDQPPRLGA